jgi:hypothetical protein
VSRFGGGIGPGCLVTFFLTALGLVLVLAGAGLVLFPAAMIVDQLRSGTPIALALLGLTLAGGCLVAAGVWLLRRFGSHNPW